MNARALPFASQSITASILLPVTNSWLRSHGAEDVLYSIYEGMCDTQVSCLGSIVQASITQIVHDGITRQFSSWVRMAAKDWSLAPHFVQLEVVYHQVMIRVADGAAAFRHIRSSTDPESDYVLDGKCIKSRCNMEYLGDVRDEVQISAQLPEELPRFTPKTIRRSTCSD